MGQINLLLAALAQEALDLVAAGDSSGRRQRMWDETPPVVERRDGCCLISP